MYIYTYTNSLLQQLKLLFQSNAAAEHGFLMAATLAMHMATTTERTMYRLGWGSRNKRHRILDKIIALHHTI